MRITPRNHARRLPPKGAPATGGPARVGAELPGGDRGGGETVGWAVWHDTDSRRNLAGLPDLELVRDRLVKAELKRQTGNPTPGQEGYLLALARAGVETYLWRPADWAEIVGVLKRGGDR